MYLLKLKLLKILNESEKTNLLLTMPDIKTYNLLSLNKTNLILKGGSNYDKDYKNTYNHDSGKFNLNINANKYYYKVERYSPDNDDEFIFVDIITIKDKYKNNIQCGSIQIDKNKKIANIISLGNSEKCLKSENENIKFKYGDIILQIIIYICKKEHMVKIELTDNSEITCNKYKLNLMIFKTITSGCPHYVKYGFKFKDKYNRGILNDNYINYLKDPQINKSELIEIIKNNGDNEIIDKLFDVINKIDNSTISIKKFILLLTRDLENKKYCKFANNIYRMLYAYGGYKPYSSQHFSMTIENN
jgi:hypothetical protein